MSHEKPPIPAVEKKKLVPIEETENTVSYLGVTLEKAQNVENAPRKEHFADYINDQFSLELQKMAAVSFKQGDPLLLEGGTSIGKTRTLKKMCADLGWEVHYANLNGATDVEDLMGRYIPNHERRNTNDPEYVFADGKVTSGLRKEPGKKKLIILDEYNAAAPSIVIRLHEVLDALRQNGEVVLAEDASERLQVSHEDTKVVALMNPPGKGYLERQPLDPAQIRRFNYQKAVTDLPKQTVDHFTKSIFNLEPPTQHIPESSYLTSNETPLTPEELKDIPGIERIITLYNDFHQGAKKLLENRYIAKDQPQRFTYDDREEPRRVRDFILNFYRGDITDTMQTALRYFYAGKVLDEDDKNKLEELIRIVRFVPPASSKRVSLSESDTARERAPRTSEKKRGAFETIDGETVFADGREQSLWWKVGDKLRLTSPTGWASEVRTARTLEVVGFDEENNVIVQVDGGRVFKERASVVDGDFELLTSASTDDETLGDILGKALKETEGRKTMREPEVVYDLEGRKYETTGLQEYDGLEAGRKVRVKYGSRSMRSVLGGKDLTIKGFDRDKNVILQSEDGLVIRDTPRSIKNDFDMLPPPPPPSPSPESSEREILSEVGKTIDDVVFVREIGRDGKTRYKSSEPGRKNIILKDGHGLTFAELNLQPKKVRILEDTKPGDPDSGQYIVEIVEE